MQIKGCISHTKTVQIDKKNINNSKDIMANE